MSIQIERYDLVKGDWVASNSDEMRTFMNATGSKPLENSELEFLVSKLADGFQFFYVPNGHKYVPKANHFVFRGKGSAECQA